MSREIKFRLIKDGKIVGYENHILRPQCGESRPNVICVCYLTPEEILDPKAYWRCSWYNFRDFIDHDDKEQSTNLKDKNGVGQEIYDGDLIGTPSGIVCQVVYRELYGQWWTKFNNTSHKSQWDKPLFEVAGNSYLKVIGNIHETPADGRTN